MEGDVMTIKDPFDGLEPAGLWQHFADLTKIPRVGGQEAEVREWLAHWAEKHDFSHRIDSAGNICIYVPASEGMSGSKTIAFQSHMDMVCAVSENSSSDPWGGKIKIIRDGDWITAPESTLGADNGLGIVSAMALAENKTLVHGPLELLFTVEEETTFKGALELDPSLISAKVMLNLDGVDMEVIIASAGGIESIICWPVPSQLLPEGWKTYEISLTGLRGGHSGGDIHLNCLNGIKGIVWLIQKIAGKMSFRLCGLTGGDASNAIPLHAQTIIAFPPDEVPNFEQTLSSAVSGLTSQFSYTDPDLTVSITSLDNQDIKCWSDELANHLIDLLSAIPSGVIAMEQKSPHLVETSNNIGFIKVKEEKLEIVCLSRSSVRDAQDQVEASLKSAARLAGAEFRLDTDKIPPWSIPSDSPLPTIAQTTYLEMFQRELPLVSVHGGLECGTIQEHIPGLDIISLGPVIQNCHKPGERVNIPSVSEFYDYLCELVRRLSVK